MQRNKSLAGGLVLALAAFSALGQPQQRGGRSATPVQPPQPGTAPPSQPFPGPPPEEKTSVTHHGARVGGQQINYTATAGTYIIRSNDGAPKATIFYVAYTKDDVPDVSKRPISFVYNGGPGSASLFTHMGLGPKRIVLTDDGRGMPAGTRSRTTRARFSTRPTARSSTPSPPAIAARRPAKFRRNSTEWSKTPPCLPTSSTSTLRALSAGLRPSF
jgi:hypothetical protein